ncbi:hypothetical protein H6F89_21695 [Cyanobacteria bacterium FACHB-63]|nr:hypothetical protein [Cyanobacteria bacterium FACHB-63]
MTLLNSEPIRIFIGSSPKNSIEEAVFRYTLLKNASTPLEICVIDGTTGSAKNLNTGEVKELPSDIRDRIPGATAFSMARWAIPQWCHFQGKAIYCDSDQSALADISELWNYDLAGSAIAAVSVENAKSHQGYIQDFILAFPNNRHEYYLTSVMLIDCEKLNWTINSILDLLDQQAFSLPNLMYLSEDVRKSLSISIQELPTEWNHLDIADSTSKIVHYTNLTSQPWRFHHHPLSDLWEALFLEAIEAEFLNSQEICTAQQQRWITDRIKALALMPTTVWRPVNWIWRTWSASVYWISAFLKKQKARVKFALTLVQNRTAAQ